MSLRRRWLGWGMRTGCWRRANQCAEAWRQAWWSPETRPNPPSQPSPSQRHQYAPPTPSPTPQAQVQIINPNFVQAFQVGQVAVKQFIDRGRLEHGGEISKADNGSNLCLTYHLKRRCYSLCRGGSTHHTLSTAKNDRLATWHGFYCTAAPATTSQPPPDTQ